MAWEHGGAEFQSRFDKSTGQVQEMKEGRCVFFEVYEEPNDGAGPMKSPALT